MEQAESEQPQSGTAVVFTGHMIDPPGRETPRFPLEMEPLAAQAIGDELAGISRRANGTPIGIASAASGGDILFHEACDRMGIASIVVLPFARERFLESAANGAPGGWEQRFAELWDRRPPEQRYVVEAGQADDPFTACNMAMLDMARRLGASLEILALWDGKDSGKPGGTSAFIDAARNVAGTITLLDANAMLSHVPGAAEG